MSILRQRAWKHSLLLAVATKKRFFPSARRELKYFGYGANLSVDRFTRHQMNVKDLGNAVLGGHEIEFSLANEYKGKGYVGLHETPSGEVWGVLYEIDYLSLRLLDVMEWCGFGAYVRKKVIVKTMNGQDRSVLVISSKILRAVFSFGLLPSQHDFFC